MIEKIDNKVERIRSWMELDSFIIEVTDKLNEIIDALEEHTSVGGHITVAPHRHREGREPFKVE